MRYYFIFLFVMLSAYFNSSHACEEPKDIKSLLARIPAEDKEEIEHFFRYMVRFERFGYVIFGSRPMTWDVIEMPILSIDVEPKNSNVIKYNRLQHNYSIWLKYQHLFPITNYILRISNPTKDFPFTSLVFINKRICFNIIQKHLILFKKILGSSITPEEIVQRLEKKENTLGDALKGSHVLIGILLGFGKHNSLVFQQWIDIWNNCHPPYDFKLLENIYGNKMTPFPHSLDYKFPSLIDLPYFGEDRNHPESVQVRESYIQTTPIIADIYTKENFLEIFLTALTKAR